MSSAPKESDVLDDLVPLIARLARPVRMAAGIGGSRAKARTDGNSDHDFRVFADQRCGSELRETPEYAAFGAGMPRWEARLAASPEALRGGLTARNMVLLRYWRDDCHHERKVLHGEVVFLAGLASRLVHGVMQVVLAPNRRWFPGDGWPLVMTEWWNLKPADLSARITAMLAPAPSPSPLISWPSAGRTSR